MESAIHTGGYFNNMRVLENVPEKMELKVKFVLVHFEIPVFFHKKHSLKFLKTTHMTLSLVLNILIQ